MFVFPTTLKFWMLTRLVIFSCVYNVMLHQVLTWSLVAFGKHEFEEMQKIFTKVVGTFPRAVTLEAAFSLATLILCLAGMLVCELWSYSLSAKDRMQTKYVPFLTLFYKEICEGCSCRRSH